jgi:hypothetical protein
MCYISRNKLSQIFFFKSTLFHRVNLFDVTYKTVTLCALA